MQAKTFGSWASFTTSVGAGALTQSQDYSYLALPVAIISGTVFVVLTVMYLVSNRREIRSGLTKLGTWYFIIPCLAVAVIAIAGAAYGLGLKSSTASTSLLLAPEKTAAASNQPSYVGNIRFNSGIGDNSVVLLEFKANDYMDRLRVYVEFSSSQHISTIPAVWGPKYKIQIADLRDVTKGQAKTVPLIYESHNPGQNAAFWWGDPEVKLKDGTPLLDRAKNKARIYFVGPDNKELPYKIIAIKTTHDVFGATLTGAPVVTILDENEIKSAFDWPEEK
jgi:hypothetical protein